MLPVGTVTVVKRLYSGCYSVCARRAITATPPLSLSLVHLSVVVVARITCANVTPAGPDHVTTCSRDTHHCHALFSSLEGTLLVLTPNQKLRWLPQRINLNVSVLNFTGAAPRGGFVPLLHFPGCSRDHDRQTSRCGLRESERARRFLSRRRPLGKGDLGDQQGN